MKFRFTLTHRGSEAEPIAIPPLDQWSTQTGAGEEWSEGPVPSVNLAGTFITPVNSEYLYVDFGFEDGIEYTLTLQHTTAYNSGSSNPRTVTLAVLDNSFAIQFSAVDTFPTSPGGTDTISLSFTANTTSTKIGFKATAGSNVTIVVNEASGTGTDPSDVTESLQISEPDGWKEAVMKLARDKEFHSLVELFDGSFIFYGDNGVINGGLHFIEFYEISKGLDANIEILIEIAPDDETYETCFFGQLDLSLAERLPKNKFRIPIIRDNFWAKFNSRLRTPVDLQAGADLDGMPIEPVEPVDINLLPQRVIARTQGTISTATGYGGIGDAVLHTDFLQISWDDFSIDEIEDRFNYPNAKNTLIPFETFAIKYAGEYEFDFKIYFTSPQYDVGLGVEFINYTDLSAPESDMEILFMINGVVEPVIFTRTDLADGIFGYSQYTFAATYTLKKGDLITIVGDPQSTVVFFHPIILGVDNTGTSAFAGSIESGFSSVIPEFPNITEDNFISVIGNTVYPSSTAPGFLIHDAAAAILKAYGLGPDNPFYSELMGSALTNARIYGADGCAWKYLLLRGLQIRGYTLTDKPVSMSFEQWWKGIDPILCLALWYEEIEGSTVDVEELAIQDLDEWDNAGGPFPGAWDYGTFLLPFTSINGGGGVEGYTCGLWPAQSGVTYVLTTVVEIFDTGGVNPVNITLIWAALDASFNELVTEEFTYTSEGFKVETFNMTPPTDATYFAVRVINDTVSDTKTLAVRLALGETTEQLLENEEFTTSSDWTNEGAGTSWTVGSGVATVSLTSTFTASKALTQLITTDKVGRYHFISEYRPSGVSGGDEITMSILAYDEDDNVLGVSHQPTTDDSVKPWYHTFVTIVPVAKIELFMTMSAGTNASVEIPYAALFVVVPTEPIVTPSQQVIRVEEREQVFLEEMSVLISNIEDISRKYDTEKIYNKVEIGYTQWQSEDVSGIDDPQTKHIYSTRFQKVGQPINVMSDFIAASLAIETTRRQTIEKSTDYKFDNNTFIIAINPDDVSPDSYVPEMGENFSSVLNLLNPDTRYNIRISVARNFLRWRKWFNGCLQSYLSSFFKFVSGEGNFDMVSTIDESPDCLGEDNDGQPLSEKQDIDVTDTIIHTPFYYEFEIDMEWETYKTIRENRRNAIGISLTNVGHVPLFIDQLDYQVMGGKAKITGWTKEYFALDVIEGAAATQDCLPSTACENPITDENDENITTETGVCITA